MAASREGSTRLNLSGLVLSHVSMISSGWEKDAMNVQGTASGLDRRKDIWDDDSRTRTLPSHQCLPESCRKTTSVSANIHSSAQEVTVFGTGGSQ